MARRINEVEIGEQLSAQKIWMRENSRRDLNKTNRLRKAGVMVMLAGVAIALACMVVGEYAASVVGVALVGMGTVLTNR